jgi:hypothetical protein
MKRASALIPLTIRVLPKHMLHPAGRKSNMRNPSIASSIRPPNNSMEPARPARRLALARTRLGLAGRLISSPLGVHTAFPPRNSLTLVICDRITPEWPEGGYR